MRPLCVGWTAATAKSSRLWVETGFLVSPLESNSTSNISTIKDEDLPIVVDELASMVAVSGDHVEEIARARNVGEQTLA